MTTTGSSWADDAVAAIRTADSELSPSRSACHQPDVQVSVRSQEADTHHNADKVPTSESHKPRYYGSVYIRCLTCPISFKRLTTSSCIAGPSSNCTASTRPVACPTFSTAGRISLCRRSFSAWIRAAFASLSIRVRFTWSVVMLRGPTTQIVGKLLQHGICLCWSRDV